MADLWRLQPSARNDVFTMRRCRALKPGDVLLCSNRRAEARRLIALADTAPGEATALDIRKAKALAAAIGRATAIVVDDDLPPEAVQPFGWRVAEAAEAMVRAARIGP